MAVAGCFAVGAAAVSGIALGTSCNSRLGRLEAVRLSREEREEDVEEVVPRARSSNQAAKRKPIVAEEGPELPLGFQGFSMEEARVHTDHRQSLMMSKTPWEALAELQRGNTRFWMGRATRPEKSAFERRGLISKQFPTVAVLGCSDSRVPSEIIFDQGLGDLFVIRVAGNCLGTSTMASLQYAIQHLKVKVVVVMGHEACGAVKAAQLPSEKLEQEPSELEQALKGIKAGLDTRALQCIQDSRARDREAVNMNVKQQVERLASDKGIVRKVRQQNLIVVGAFYDISSGIVDFFHEFSGVSPATTLKKGSPTSEEPAWTRQPSDGVQSRYEPHR